MVCFVGSILPGVTRLPLFGVTIGLLSEVLPGLTFEGGVITDGVDTPVLRLSLYAGNMHRLFMTRVLGCAI